MKTKYRGEHVILFSMQIDAQHCTVFLKLSEHGPGAYQDVSIGKASRMTWKRMWPMLANLYTKAKIREKKLELGTYVY